MLAEPGSPAWIVSEARRLATIDHGFPMICQTRMAPVGVFWIREPRELNKT